MPIAAKLRVGMAPENKSYTTIPAAPRSQSRAAVRKARRSKR